VGANQRSVGFGFGIGPFFHFSAGYAGARTPDQYARGGYIHVGWGIPLYMAGPVLIVGTFGPTIYAPILVPVVDWCKREIDRFKASRVGQALGSAKQAVVDGPPGRAVGWTKKELEAGVGAVKASPPGRIMSRADHAIKTAAEKELHKLKSKVHSGTAAEEPMLASESILAPEPTSAPEPVSAPEPAHVPEAARVPEPAHER
jgi:hypothetical protein